MTNINPLGIYFCFMSTTKWDAGTWVSHLLFTSPAKYQHISIVADLAGICLGHTSFNPSENWHITRALWITNVKRDKRKKENDWSGQLQSVHNEYLVVLNRKHINVFSFICCVKQELIWTGLAIQKKKKKNYGNYAVSVYWHLLYLGSWLADITREWVPFTTSVYCYNIQSMHLVIRGQILWKNWKALSLTRTH